MTRRTLLHWLAALRAWAQTATFPGKHGDTLRELGAAVLPASLGREATDRIVAAFERWVREYRPGASMDHGYGFTRIRTTPPSPAAKYLAQLETLRQPLSGSDAAAKRKAIESALTEAKIVALPRSPDGKHVISDLMGFYFNSSDGYDLCYRAAIARDRCRGLEGSGNPPPPLNGVA